MLVLTEENFQKEVLESDKPVLVDFWATWCHPCKLVAPELEKFNEQYGDKIKIGKVDIDDYTPLALKYDVQYVPTLMLFEQGEVKAKSVGFISFEDMQKKFL